MTKKLLAILLSVLMVLALFAGCTTGGQSSSAAEPSSSSSSSKTEDSKSESSKDESSEPEPEEPVTITMMSLGFTFWQDDFYNTIYETPIWDQVYEATGVDWQFVGLDGEQSQIHIASNELGDIVQIIGSAADLDTLYTNEQIIPLNDLVEQYAPHIKNDFPGRWAWCCNAVAQEPGTAYTLAVDAGDNNYNTYSTRYVYTVRWDLYKELGYPEITDLNSYLDVAEDMWKLQPKTADGKNVYAFSFPGSSILGLDQDFLGTFGYMDRLGGYVLERYTDNSICYAFTDDDSPLWMALEFYNKVYRRGMLDPDCFTQTDDDYKSKVTTGEVMFYNMYQDTFLSFGQNMLDNDADSLAVLVSVPVPGAYAYQGGSGNGWGLAFCDSITSSCERPDMAMKLIGYLFSEEGSRLGWSGAKGVDWDYNDAGEPVFTDEFYAKAADPEAGPPYTAVTCMANWVGITSGQLLSDGGYTSLRAGNDYLARQPMLPGYKDFCEYFNVVYPCEALKKAVEDGTMAGDIDMTLGLSLPAASEDIARIEEGIVNYFTENFPDAVTAPDDAAFAAIKANMIAKMLDLGAETAKQYWVDGWAKAIEDAK